MRFVLIVAALAACSSPAAQRAPASPAAPAAPTAAASAAPSTDRGLEPPMPTLRLPRNFVPTGYQARLSIDPAQSGFDGAIAIAGKVTERSGLIWLHGRHLTIKHAAAKSDAGATVELAVTPRGEDLLEIRAASPLAAGSWTLAIDYTGVFDELNTAGAFKQTINGAPYVFTQFESLYARWAFPCLDEPDSKVPWQLTLDVPAKLVAVSNTPVVHEEAHGDRKRVEFAPTKPLPSYLIAFGVGPFDVVDGGHTKSGTPVRIIALGGRGEHAAWAAKTTARIIDLLEDYFGIPYPYEKMDMMSIPVTVGFGAMENAGLITFTETLILFDPKHASRAQEYGWVDVAAHELAHQWFGDLVTTAWWDDIWLNEGFADWMEHKIAGRFEPAWHEDLSAVDDRDGALNADSLVSARQIRQPITSVSDIDNAFDGITYNKGAAVLNMFENYLGREKFQQGIRDYIAAHRFGNSTSEEFAAAISKAAGRNVAAAFATFLEQPGTPEITATLACEAGKPPRVDLHQQRYLPPGAPTPSGGKPWIVPVCVAYEHSGKRTEQCAMLDAPTGSIALETTSCPRWMMPNANGRGYYRNHYTAAEVAALRDQAWPQLTPAERSVMMFDIDDAAEHGQLPFALALSFGPKLIAAGDRFSMGTALELPAGVRQFVPAELKPAFVAALRKDFGAAAHKAGLTPRDDDSLDTETVRRQMIQIVGNFARDPQITAEAIKLSEKWRDLPTGVRREIIATAAHASPAVFDRLFKQVPSEPDRQRREELIGALASTPDIAQQRRALGMILDPAIDVRDTQFVLFAADGEEARNEAQHYFKANKDAILKRIPTTGTSAGQAVYAYIFTSSCDPARRDEIAKYVDETFSKMEGGERTVRQAIERMDQCIARRKLIEPEVRAWLTGGAPGGAAKAAHAIK